MKAIKALLAVSAFSAFSAVASAAIVLNVSDGNGTGPFGNIILTQGVNFVTVFVALDSPYEFVDTGSHQTFGFNLSGSPAVSFTDITPGYYVGATFSNGFAGAFAYSIACSSAAGKPPDACGTGGSNPAPGPLSFNVNKAGLLISDFIANGNGFTFAADVIGPNATGATFTGLVESTGSCPEVGGPSCKNNTVPEPITSGLVGTGLISLFFLRRRVRG